MSVITTTEPSKGQEQQGGDSGYTPPASQADLDKIIADRLSRERGKFADYDDLKTKAEKLDELEAAGKTEVEKLTERLTAVSTELDGYKKRDEVTGWAQEITKDSPVPPDALRGSTREELEKHHTQLASLLTGKVAPRTKTAVPPGTSPTERGGTTGSRAAEAVRQLRGTA